METGWLRIYFDENVYTTVPCTPGMTSSAICIMILKKKGLGIVSPLSHALYIMDGSHDHLYQRRLGPHECPLEVQEKSRKQGNLDHFKVIFKPVNSDTMTNEVTNYPALFPDENITSSLPSLSGHGIDYVDEASADSNHSHSLSRSQPPTQQQQAMALDPSIIRCGYLDKRGKRNTAWKERWFAINPNGLHYYKGHQSSEPIATIPLIDSFIRACHTSCQNCQPIPFVAAPSITNLTTSPPLTTPHAHSSLSKCSYEFEIHTLVRVFFLRAHSYPEMLNWIQDIQAQIPPCTENQLLDEIDLLIEDQEYAACAIDDSRLISLSSLTGALANGIAVEQFVQFETDRKAGLERSILAYLEADAFSRSSSGGLKSKQQLLTRAQGIFDNFFAAAAPQLVTCITEAQRKEIQAALAAGDTRSTLFQSVQSSLFTQLSEKSFPAFVPSKHFQRAALKLSQLNSQPGPHQIDDPSHPVKPATSFPSSALPSAPTSNMTDDNLNSPSNAPALLSLDETQPIGDVAAAADSCPLTKDVEQVSIDESHSITAPAPVGGLLSSLYGVGSAAVGAVGAFAGGVVTSTQEALLSSPSPDHLMLPSTPLSNGPMSGSGKHDMSPASLASYLESIGQADAIKRSASIAAGDNGANGHQPSTLTSNPLDSAHLGGGGDSDSDESETEEAEEESIFGATPRISGGSILGDDSDRASFSIRKPTTNKNTATIFDAKSNGTKKPSSAISSAQPPANPIKPLTSITVTPSESVDDDDDFFSITRTRSVNSATKGLSGSHPHSTLGVISELESRTTPSVSVAEIDTRPRQSEAEGGTIDDAITPTAANGVAPSSTSSQPRISHMEPQRPVESRRRSEAMVQTHLSTSIPPAASALTVTPSSTSSAAKRKKKIRSIFDDDGEDEDEDEPDHKTTPTVRASPSSSPIVTPAKSANTPITSSTNIDLSVLNEEAVDLGDLNLDEEPDMF